MEGNDPNTHFEDQKRETALHAAAKNGHESVVFLLLQVPTKLLSQSLKHGSGQGGFIIECAGWSVTTRQRQEAANATDARDETLPQ